MPDSSGETLLDELLSDISIQLLVCTATLLGMEDSRVLVSVFDCCTLPLLKLAFAWPDEVNIDFHVLPN